MALRVHSVLSIWLVLSFVLVPLSRADSATPISVTSSNTTSVTAKPEKVVSRCRRLILAASIFAGVALAPTLFHEARASISGKQHLGRGIYLDMEDIEEVLSDREKYFLGRAKEKPLLATRILVNRLKGDYGNWLFSPFALPTNATEYLAGAGKDRGVCRHKACILKGILDAKGVDVRLQSGFNLVSPHRWHVWVYFPESDMIADPTEGTITEAAEYYKKFDVRVDGVPLPGGWY